MRRLCDCILGGIVKCGYAVWRGIAHILYRPRLVFIGDAERIRSALRAPAVLISNHRTHLDGTLLPITLHRYRVVTFVARDWYDKPKLNPLFRHLPFLPMDRFSMDTEWLSLGEGVLGDGKSILLFPEGKTGKTDALHPFMPGFALLARRADVPVIPLVIPREYRKFRRNVICIGEPLARASGAGRLSRLCREDAAEAEGRMYALMGAQGYECNLPAGEVQIDSVP